jgi:AAA15 family ATPase/GTPase
MKKISIKNFRVFKDQQEMEFKPITVLVGPNNSGKSTIFKSLKLIKFDTSSFTLPYFIDSRLGTNYEHTESNILSDNKEALELNYHIPFSNNISLNLVLNYNEFGLRSCSLIYLKKKLFLFEFKPAENTWQNEKGISLINAGVDLKLLRLLFVNYLKAHKKTISSELNEAEKSLNFGDDQFGFKSWLFEHKTNENRTINELIKISKQEFFIIEPVDNIVSLTNEEIKRFNEIQNKIINSPFSLVNNEIEKDEILKIFASHDRYRTLNNIGELTSLFNFSVALFEAKISNQMISNLTNTKTIHSELNNYFKSDFVPMIEGKIKTGITQFSKIEKIPTIKSANNKYFFLNQHTDSFFGETVKLIFHSYSLPDHDRQGINFIERWLKRFNIGTEIIPKKINDDILEIYIKDFSGREINIFDMGFGVSQLLSIIALPLKNFQKVEDYMNDEDADIGGRNYNHTEQSPFYFLEEPESNLHPNWQSLLIELISEMQKTFGIHFLIETHSEYMIRKLQYLIAKKKISSEDVEVLYINRDQDVSEKEPKIKKIIIRDDGIIANSFGPGFFDEAARLTIDLLTIKDYN